MKKEKNSIEYNLFEDFGYIDEENIMVGAVTQAVQGNKNSAKKTQRIEDFGEKIGGARKDLYAAYCDLVKTAKENEIEKVPLSKAFPAPNYKKLLEMGVERWKVDAIRALRDTIPQKPRKYSWLINEWTEKVSILRDMSISVLEDKWTREEFLEEVERIKKKESEYDFKFMDVKEIGEKIADYMLIYGEMGHEKDCSGLSFERRYNDDDNKVELCEKHGFRRYRMLTYGETKLDALEKYSNQERYEEKKPRQKKSSLQVYSWRYGTYYFIGSKIGKDYAEIKSPFETVEEARKYLETHQEELEEKLEKYRQIPYERESENLPRTGEFKRIGDITPEQFQETFGFRGVEFGNWVENETRQEDLNQTYDALMDIAEVLNLPPRALSLNGKLGLAYGSRGKGGKNAPMAHYEHQKVAINLTKKKGAGTLGHEWFHSLDNYFGRKEKNIASAMLTQNVKEKEAENISPEVMEAFQLISKVIKQSNFSKRSEKLDRHKDKAYWTLAEEMAARAFESYLKSKLEEKGIRNDYLVNYKNGESWEKASEEGFNLENTYPYPTVVEMEDIKMAYEYLFDSIRFQQHDKNYELYSATAGNIQELLKDSRLLFEKELNPQQLALQKMSEEVFDIDLKYFEGAGELHGRYDEGATCSVMKSYCA